MSNIFADEKVQTEVDLAVFRLREAGYSVIREPRPDQLPEELRSFRPDYIAIQGDELIIGEVKLRSSTDLNDELRQLTAVVSLVPRWRLELVWLGEELEPAATATAIAQIVDRVLAVDRVDRDAALLLAWSGFEAAIEKLMRRLDLYEGQPNSTRARIATLYSLGLFSDSQYEFLQSTAAVRAEVAHGVGHGSTDQVDIGKLLEQILWLSNDNYMSVDQMIDWFMQYYEDPAQGVPYDSREGGYQYVAGGPYDALEVLSGQFSSAPHEVIEEAADRLAQESLEWVWKGDY